MDLTSSGLLDFELAALMMPVETLTYENSARFVAVLEVEASS
jgi:hypothetical protein